MKKSAAVLLTAVSVLFLNGCCIKHHFAPATCTEPSTCVKCGYTTGEALGQTGTADTPDDTTRTEPQTDTGESAESAPDAEPGRNPAYPDRYDAFEILSGIFGTEGGQSENTLSEEKLIHQLNEDGIPVIPLSPEDWDNIADIDMNLVIDVKDKGLVVLGTDFSPVDYLDDNGNLIYDFDKAWITVNGWTASYTVLEKSYLSDGSNKYCEYGYIPVLFNGEPAYLHISMENFKVTPECIETRGGDIIAMSSLTGKDTIRLIAQIYSYTNDDNTFYLTDDMPLDEGITVEYLYFSEGKDYITFYSIYDKNGDFYNTEFCNGTT